MRLFGLPLGVAAMLLITACGGAARTERVLVAAGTTLVDSGLIDALADRYEAANPGVKISVVGEASAQVIELGRRGAADVLITHAPALEEAFVADGRAELSAIAFTSDFVLVGPPELVDTLDGPVGQVMADIAQRGLAFISRADGSGTYERELGLWAEAGVDPSGASWYRQSGQGMGLTLIIADQKSAFTLAERGAFVAAGLALRLVDLQPDPGLDNPYRVTLVTDRGDPAGRFARWLIEQAPLELAAINQELFGKSVYRPAD